MKSDFRIISSSDIISSVTDFSKRNDSELCSVWNKVVSKIGYKEGVPDSENNFIGNRLAANSKVVDLKNGVLLVETNHSGWIQYLRMYQKFILNGLKWSLPSLKISSLAFRVRGSEASLSDIYENHFEKAQKEMEEKIRKEEEELENRFGKNSSSGGIKSEVSEESGNFGSNPSENKENDGKKYSKLPEELFQRLEKLKKE